MCVNYGKMLPFNAALLDLWLKMVKLLMKSHAYLASKESTEYSMAPVIQCVAFGLRGPELPVSRVMGDLIYILVNRQYEKSWFSVYKDQVTIDYSNTLQIPAEREYYNTHAL